MSEKISIDEWLFALGIYPNLNAMEKYRLFSEMVYNFTLSSECMNNQTNRANGYYLKKMQKLSNKKKASFASFLEKLDIEKEMKRYENASVFWIHILSDRYPKHLTEIYSPPVVLFYQGNINLAEDKIWLGVVGARKNTQYGMDAVTKIVSGILSEANEKIGIISGLAKGIDRKAHEETIRNNGKTIGVIGTGLDISYPYQNKKLQKEISKNHLLLSEYPLQAKPLKYHFPERNRIISGISRGVLVIEAKKRSGSLITAYNAIDENRDVFALPGSIFAENFVGSHKLIQLGAVLVQSHEDILQEWSNIKL